jgi:hypothetical protein
MLEGVSHGLPTARGKRTVRSAREEEEHDALCCREYTAGGVVWCSVVVRWRRL